jgi:hypothetical protein
MTGVDSDGVKVWSQMQAINAARTTEPIGAIKRVGYWPV